MPMVDFNLKSYLFYLHQIKRKYANILTFYQYFSKLRPPNSFCILRHDVDRNPKSALRMAQLECDLGICSTYYFRTRRHVAHPAIIRKIFKMGHEIGYHYESWADCKGNQKKSLEDFEKNLKKLRQWVPVHTIAMHGRPLSKLDNRDMWRSIQYHQLLQERYNIKGEIYLDIDYTDIAYINDTGRNWRNNMYNIQDKVESDLSLDLEDQQALIRYLEKPHPKLVLLIHPERWQDNFFRYAGQLGKDRIINLIKLLL
jgi:hypothetical protein